MKASRESETKKISTSMTQNANKWREAIERESEMVNAHLYFFCLNVRSIAVYSLSNC